MFTRSISKNLLVYKNIKFISDISNKSLKVQNCKNNKLSIYSNTNLTQNQHIYYDLLKDKTNKIIVVNGPAGCGKTWLACTYAINEFKNKNIEKLVITRPIVSVDEDLGYLPGNINKKMDPWMKPIFDVFLEYYKKDELTKMITNNSLEIAPLAYMRGRTFKNSFIIADEMQNSSCNQMLMLLTRIGLNSRMIVTGDLGQSDLEEENGLEDLNNRLKEYKISDINNKINQIEFHNNDIQRSKIVEEVMKLYSDSDKIYNIEYEFIDNRFNTNDYFY
jgi:phosphate starvation-inducible PhoH-like protein